MTAGARSGQNAEGVPGSKRRLLPQALARLAHQRDGLREDGGHHRADLLGLLLGGALDVDAIDRRDGEVDRELDRVVRPGQLLLALHLLRELRHPALELLGIAEQATKAFHARIVAPTAKAEEHRPLLAARPAPARLLSPTMPVVEGAGVPLRYAERGTGEAVLLIHGMGADAQALQDLGDALAGEARVVAYDRRGYGGSGAPEPYGGTTVEEQAEDAAALLRALDAAPATVAGEGFGALVALDLLSGPRRWCAPRSSPSRRCTCSSPRPPRPWPWSAGRSRRPCTSAGPAGVSKRGWAIARTPRRAGAPPTRTAPSSPTTPAWRAGP